MGEHSFAPPLTKAKNEKMFNVRSLYYVQTVLSSFEDNLCRYEVTSEEVISSYNLHHFLSVVYYYLQILFQTSEGKI